MGRDLHNSLPTKIALTHILLLPESIKLLSIRMDTINEFFRNAVLHCKNIPKRWLREGPSSSCVLHQCKTTEIKNEQINTDTAIRHTSEGLNVQENNNNKNRVINEYNLNETKKKSKLMLKEILMTLKNEIIPRKIRKRRNYWMTMAMV